MQKEKIKLEKEKETLLIPPYCRTLESNCRTTIITDKKAVETVNQVEYDFPQLKIPKETHVTTCMRAKQLDKCVRAFLSRNPNGIVVQLGCGLDSRFDRKTTAQWNGMTWIFQK